jgi:hypothetical protein
MAHHQRTKLNCKRFKEVRIKEAKERAEARSKRSSKEQLARLDQMGMRAKKERLRLSKTL